MYFLSMQVAKARLAASRSHLRQMGMIHLRERFYGDGPPQWTMGPNDKSCETAADALQARKIAIKRLRRQAEVSLDAERATIFEEMANTLQHCEPYQRCRHSACPLCLRALQRWFVWTAPTALRIGTQSSGKQLVVLSIIPRLRLTVGATLPHMREQVTRVLTLLRKGLDDAGVKLLSGGIDISLNDEPTPKSPYAARRLRVQLHLWAIGPEQDIRQAEKTLRGIFPSSKQIPKPVYIRNFDGQLKGYAYALKTNFQRRIRLAPQTEKGRNTRNKSFTSEQTAEVMLLLEMIGDRRLLLIGADISKNKRKKTVIRAN
jgi:hypothetical protein